MERQTGTIRLTNKTALALRKSARQEQTLTRWTIVIVTVVLLVAAVLFGIRWIPAVPMLTGLAVLLDAALYVRGRSRYLSLTGQAICAEAAARQMREGSMERERHAQALRDLNEMKADVMSSAPQPHLAKQSEDDPDLNPPEEKPRDKLQGNAYAKNSGGRQNPLLQMDEQGSMAKLPNEPISGKTIVRAAIKPVYHDDAAVTTGKTIMLTRVKGVQSEEQPLKVDEQTPAHRRRRQAALTVLMPEDDAGTSN